MTAPADNPRGLSRAQFREVYPEPPRFIQRWRGSVLEGYAPPVRALLVNEVRRVEATETHREGTARLAELHGELSKAHLSRAFDEDLLRDAAENYARLCSRMGSLEARQSFALGTGIEPPAGKTITREGATKRLDDPSWWRRQLRKRWTRAAENALRDLGLIRRHRQPYASDEAVRHRAAQRRRGREFLAGSVAVNEHGEQLELLKLAESSVSNPALRRGEMMCRARGFERIAADLGHAAEFVTLTAPGTFHAQLARAGRNPAYQRQLVRDAQQWLCRMWARARAKLKRLSITVYGFRIAEPHHDATPHWHLLLFVVPHHAGTLRAVLRGFWLSEFADEPGAAEHRARFEAIDTEKGSATGYVAKYVAKNIDGAGAIGEAEDWETGGAALESIARVDAWASIHGIRQFQQIGGPPVGLWREARRLRDPVEDADIERARLCADRGDWRHFIDAVGGLRAGRRTSLKLEKVDTGEANRYGEEQPQRVVGLRYCSSVVISRPHRWRIERKNSPQGAVPVVKARDCSRATGETGTDRPAASALSSPRSGIFSALGPVAITVRGAAGAGSPSAWSNPQETSRAGPRRH